MQKSQLDDWAFARIELGISTQEYLDLTPVEHAALLDVWQQKQKSRTHEIAGLYAMMTNLLLRPEIPVTSADFLPKEPQSEDAIMAGFRAAFPQKPKQ